MRSGNAGKPLGFVWWTSDGTAHAGDDYASFGRRVEPFNRGENKHTIFIPLRSDALAEAPETFFFHIDSMPGAEPGIPAVTVDIRIIDDDRAPSLLVDCPSIGSDYCRRTAWRRPPSPFAVETCRSASPDGDATGS